MTRVHKRERGVALLLVILSLMLLTAIGLALMFSADTETSIAANYRDKQSAFYAAQAGLQEARDRLNRFNKSSPYYIASPGGLPSAAHPERVVYIINPGKGQTVNDIKPWDPTNAYYDTSICTALPAPNDLCTGSGLSRAPSVTSGYTVIDNTVATLGSVANPYHVVTGTTATPLPYQWVRVMLKADNSTPVKVNDSNAGTQVCWDEQHQSQVLLPSGYSPDCTTPGGIVTSVDLVPGNDGGHGYSVSSPPAVTFSGGSGSGATATATVQAVDTHSIESIHVDVPGAQYDTAPNITIGPPDLGGVQATAQATVSTLVGGSIDTVTLTNAGGCYQVSSPAPGVSIAGGSGSGANVTANMTGQSCVYSWSASGSCKDQAGSTITVTGSGGFQGTIRFKTGNGNVSSSSPKVTDGGSGLSPGSPPTLNVGTCSITPTFVYGYKIQSLTKNAGGTNYTSPTVAFSGGSMVGTAQPAATATTTGGSGGQVISVNITNPGSGYTSAPTVTFDPPSHGSATAQGTAILGSAIGTTGKITGFTLTNPGSGYTTAPTVTIAGGGGAQATAAISHGDYKGNVYLVTSFARAPGGSIAISEMEMANLWETSSFDFKVTGAMTLAGPNPSFSPPSSNNMVINGVDGNTCGETSNGKLPAIGVYNTNPPPLPPALNADQQVIQSLPKPGNYQGINATADVHDVSQEIGSPTTAGQGLEAEVSAIIAMPGTQHITGNANGTCSNTAISTNSCIPLGSSTQDAITVVDGNATIGPVSGYGILVVRGDLVMDGNFSWSGIILVIGNGNITWNGGGNGQVTGAVYVANTHGGSGSMTLASPDATWNGGGGNGIQYDHCRSDKLMAKVPFVAQPSNKPVRILSMRTLGNQ